MTENMKIWDALSKTDPKHTKPVQFGGRKFTSIDAHWQIQRMTEHFGPVGKGWNYVAEHSITSLTADMHLAVCDVTIQWKAEGQNATCQYGPVRATCDLYSPDKSGKMRLDDDAPKKCLTDALTKGLSHLGVSADVFLGLYDDNKYVAKMKAEFAAQPQDAPQEQEVTDGARRWVADQKTFFASPLSRGDLEQWKEKNSAALRKLAKNYPKLWDEVMMAYETRVEGLQGAL